MKCHILKGIAYGIAGTLLVAGTASATPLLEISYGSTTVRVADNTFGGTTIFDSWTTTHADAAAAYNPFYFSTVYDGAIQWGGAIGDFSLDVSTGLTKDALGSAGEPKMHLSSTNSSTGPTDTLTIKFTEIDFGPMLTGLEGFVSGLTSLDAIQTLSVFYDTTNSYFGTETQIANIGPLADAVDFATWNNIPSANPFSLTMIATVKHDVSGGSSFDAGVNPVPEPTTMLLFGTGLIGLGGLARKRRECNKS